MIICIIGGIGSGKTLTAIKEIVTSRQYSLTNFNLKNLKGKYHRISIKDVINEKDETNENTKIKTKKKIYSVNWNFWDRIRKKHRSFSIYLDEIHNIIHSRRSMSRTNIMMSKWVSQIRKITQDSPNNHLYIISQTLRKIDIDFRELAQIFIRCQKVELNDSVYIINKFYEREDDIISNKKPILKQTFKANKFFNFYDTTEMVQFDDAEVYI